MRAVSMFREWHAQIVAEAQARRPGESVSMRLTPNSCGFWLTLRVGSRDVFRVWGDAQSVAYGDMCRTMGFADVPSARRGSPP